MLQAKDHPYYSLSLEEAVELLFLRDALIAELQDARFLDRATQLEYARLIWGKKSEKHVRTLATLSLDSSQPELPLEGVDKVLTTQETILISESPTLGTTEKVKYLRRPVPGGRKKLSATLPREYWEILPPGYHEGMVKIDSVDTEELDYRTGSFFIRVISRPRFADSRTKGVVIAPMPLRPVHKSIAGAGLLAYILVSRFCDHLPYYRQVRILNRYGENIVNTSTVGRWAQESINLLAIIYSRIRLKVLESGYIQADETTIKVLDRTKPTGRHQGYLWGYHAPARKLVLIEYGKGRAADYPEAFLGKFTGVFQTDAYGAYDKLLKGKDHLVHVACWAHARRNFFKAGDSDKRRADQAMELIARLYAVEATIKQTGASAKEILCLRTEISKPALAEIKAWADLQVAELNPKSLISTACRYMLSRWDKLSYYTNDSSILIDNNILENRFRPVALGRRNWLFAGNHESAERSGIIYSIIESCALNNVEPFTYLKDVLLRLPYMQNATQEKIDDLLPGNWKAQPEIIYQAARKLIYEKVG